MNKYKYIFLALSIVIATSCSKDEDITNSFDPTWEAEEQPEGTVATISAFEPGDAVTRSTWAYNGQKYVFGWQAGDQLGVIATAAKPKPLGGKTWAEINPTLIDPTTKQHPNYLNDTLCYIVTENSVPKIFTAKSPKSNSQTARIYASESQFEWDARSRWTAYYPLAKVEVNEEPKGYDQKEFNFEGQVQDGIPDFAAYKSNDNTTYVESESKACKHLGEFDYMISPETQYDSEATTLINFQFRHIGAIARLYLAAPKKNLVITKVQLICDKKIFYTKGTFDLTSHPYNASATDGNYGVVTVGYSTADKPSQIKPITESLTNMIELNFKDDLAKTYYDANNVYKRYMAAYIMMYPITYNSTTDGNLFAYVTAYEQDDTSKKELHFVSSALASKAMKSGCYYQWTSATHEDDGLYPIELTATLLPWQDIVGGGIETDLTK